MVEFYHLPQEVAFKIITDIQVSGIDTNDYPEFTDAYIESAKLNGKEMTEEQLEAINENKEFVYEISCDQICGSGHYSMRGVIIVETQEEYDAWLASKKPQYLTVKEAAAPAPATADSTAAVSVLNTSKPLAQLK